jgi:hypothetical protein
VLEDFRVKLEEDKPEGSCTFSDILVYCAPTEPESLSTHRSPPVRVCRSSPPATVHRRDPSLPAVESLPMLSTRASSGPCHGAFQVPCPALSPPFSYPCRKLPVLTSLFNYYLTRGPRVAPLGPAGSTCTGKAHSSANWPGGAIIAIDFIYALL